VILCGATRRTWRPAFSRFSDDTVSRVTEFRVTAFRLPIPRYRYRSRRVFPFRVLIARTSPRVHGGPWKSTSQTIEPITENVIIDHDEVHNYIEARYVGLVETTWRILGKKLQDKNHSKYVCQSIFLINIIL